MDESDNLEAYYSKNHKFKSELVALREIAQKTEATETFKWNSPVYAVGGKNVFGIRRFQNHFVIWFFNGVYMNDPLNVLEAAQESTRALRHWKFGSGAEIKAKDVLAYMKEAIRNQKDGIEHKNILKKGVVIPVLLKKALKLDGEAAMAFKAMAPYKQREFCEYISSAKQEKTKKSRLDKSISLIKDGSSLHEKYRRDK